MVALLLILYPYLYTNYKYSFIIIHHLSIYGSTTIQRTQFSSRRLASRPNDLLRVFLLGNTNAGRSRFLVRCEMDLSFQILVSETIAVFAIAIRCLTSLVSSALCVKALRHRTIKNNYPNNRRSRFATKSRIPSHPTGDRVEIDIPRQNVEFSKTCSFGLVVKHGVKFNFTSE